MRLLTGAVIGMGVLIVIGLILLAVGLVRRAGEAPAAPAADGSWRTGTVSLGLPAAAEVLRMTAVSGGLALLVRLPSGERVVYAVPLDRRQPPFRIQVTGPRGD